MASRELMNLIANLSGEEEAVVEEFIKYLKQSSLPSSMTFRAALDSFVRDHPELLRRLAE